MRFRMEIDENLEEDEIILKCRELSTDVQNLQAAIYESLTKRNQFVLYKENTEYYLSPSEILFFETEAKGIMAHTREDVFLVKYKLYELEEILPGNFLRISKSGIVNMNEIFSITRNLTGASAVEFKGTHKKIFVSRSYYKVLKDKLEEKRKMI